MMFTVLKIASIHFYHVFLLFVLQVSLPHEAVSAPKSVPAPEVKPVSVSINKPEVVSAIEKPAKAEKQGKAKAKAERKSAAESAPPAEGKKKQQQPPEDVPVDVGRLDFRVGRITNAKKHPDADALYVEEVDLGEEKPRTVVSGLVAYVPVEQLQNRLVVLLCNLKPVKMRGVTSEAMVMCASTPEKVEVLIPPNGSVPGDIVAFDGYERRPDAVLNPKKKIFETVAPDLKTDAKKVATYKGVPFTVPGKGVVTAPSLTNVQIK